MSKRPRHNGYGAMERRLKEGRGQGRGAAYKPWLLIHDVPSLGQANRVKSPLHGRTCHLMSQLETDWFFALHAVPKITDLREQFPLLDLDETLEIAAQLEITHPTDPKSREPCVVTTDFVITQNQGLRDIETAIAVKPSSELGSNRTLEKLEIERVYWSARNIAWHVLTEQELPKALVKNLRWLYPHWDLSEEDGFSPSEISRIRKVMEPAIQAADRSLVEVTTECDDRLGLEPGVALIRLAVCRCFFGRF